MVQTQTQTGLQIRPLGPALGAEIRGVDMGKPIDAATFNALHEAWMQYLVVVLPGQRVSDAQHVEFGGTNRRIVGTANDAQEIAGVVKEPARTSLRDHLLEDRHGQMRLADTGLPFEE